jgi:pimeloyl-ACP methyl ester carboxylesterase
MGSAVVVVALTLAAGSTIDFRIAEVSPERAESASWVRTPGARRAIILIHGLKVHAFFEHAPYEARFDSWQKPGSRLVKGLALLGDVYAAAYSQNVAVEKIAADARWLLCIASIHALGYQEIILVGHSAGGIIARELVEDHPQCGCTKVVQVCAPNGGSAWAEFYPGVVKGQTLFVRSLTSGEREQAREHRANRQIPTDVEFVCLVGSGEFLVTHACQWPLDLQAQGIPARLVDTAHPLAVRSATGVGEIVHAVRDRVSRWNKSEVAEARKLLGLKSSDDIRRAPQVFDVKMNLKISSVTLTVEMNSHDGIPSLRKVIFETAK